jgi:hypothetical protein
MEDKIILEVTHQEYKQILSGLRLLYSARKRSLKYYRKKNGLNLDNDNAQDFGPNVQSFLDLEMKIKRENQGQISQTSNDHPVENIDDFLYQTHENSNEVNV